MYHGWVFDLVLVLGPAGPSTNMPSPVVAYPAKHPCPELCVVCRTADIHYVLRRELGYHKNCEVVGPQDINLNLTTQPSMCLVANHRGEGRASTRTFCGSTCAEACLPVSATRPPAQQRSQGWYQSCRSWAQYENCCCNSQTPRLVELSAWRTAVSAWVVCKRAWVHRRQRMHRLFCWLCASPPRSATRA